MSMGQSLGGDMRNHEAAMMKEGFENPPAVATAVSVLKKMTTASGPMKCMQDPLMARAMACKETLIWVKYKCVVDIRPG
nr:zinc finger protein ZAT11-like [Ipomoea batatas]GMC64346.1 zinc finger protein ZAT11-like [Ipomoea batatas]